MTIRFGIETWVLAAALLTAAFAWEGLPARNPARRAAAAAPATPPAHEHRHDLTLSRAAFDALERRAQAGEPDAQSMLGRVLMTGEGPVAADAPRAMRWLQRAAEAGDARAALDLARLLRGGRGVPTDDARAREWLNVAVQRQLPDAQFLLASQLRDGDGAARDDRRALALYRAAAEAEHAGALQALGMAYVHGELGLARDPVEGYRLLAEAAHALRHASAHR